MNMRMSKYTITRIFEPIIENPAVLLSGDHTRSIKKAAPVARKGAITMFAVKQQKCLGCRALLPKGAENEPGGALCAFVTSLGRRNNVSSRAVG